MNRRDPTFTLFPYTTLFRSGDLPAFVPHDVEGVERAPDHPGAPVLRELHDVVPHDRVPVDVAELRRSEEHTSELQSRRDLVCRLLLDIKNLLLLGDTVVFHN